MSLEDIEHELQKLKNPEKARLLQGFFKTGKGEYGEGDIFLGITVPETRKIAVKYSRLLSIGEIGELLSSIMHEERLCALLILIDKYDKGDDNTRKEIFKFYLDNTKHINNWDLVDLSSHKIIGKWLLDKKKERKLLYQLAKSNDLWEKRISIISTFAFIAKNDFFDALKISETLLNDKNDLIHKAVGWALREIGKKDQKIEKQFLRKHYKNMPRTMLRYAIEKFPEKLRKQYLNGEI